jgi:hypothetical protein
MAIAYQAIGTFRIRPNPGGVDGTTLIIPEPAGTTTDDLLVACISFRGTTTPSIPTGWTIVNRTSVVGNTLGTNAGAVGNGLMAYIKRGSSALTVAERTFGAVSGQNFPNEAIGVMIRITGQDLTDPVAGTSQNTLVTAATVATTGAFTRSFTTDLANDYIEVMMCIGAQEVTWSTQQYITGPTNFTERGLDTTSTLWSDGSLTIATGTGGSLATGFRATASAARRNSLIVASFGGPRPAATTARSFSVFV